MARRAWEGGWATVGQVEEWAPWGEAWAPWGAEAWVLEEEEEAEEEGEDWAGVGVGVVAVAVAEESALLGVAFWALRATAEGGGLFSVGQEILEGGGSGGGKRENGNSKERRGNG